MKHLPTQDKAYHDKRYPEIIRDKDVIALVEGLHPDDSWSGSSTMSQRTLAAFCSGMVAERRRAESEAEEDRHKCALCDKDTNHRAAGESRFYINGVWVCLECAQALRGACVAAETNQEAKAKEPKEPECALCLYGETNRILYPFRHSGITTLICGHCIMDLKAWLVKPDEFNQTVDNQPIDDLKAMIERLEKRLPEVNEAERLAMRLETALLTLGQGMANAISAARDQIQEGFTPAKVAERNDLTGSELCGDCGFRMAAVEGNPLCREHNGRTPNDICGYLTIGQSSRWVPRVAETEEPPPVEPTGAEIRCGNCGTDKPLSTTCPVFSLRLTTWRKSSPCGSWGWDGKTAGITDEPAIERDFERHPSEAEEPNPNIFTLKMNLEGVSELFVDGELQSDLIPDEIEVGLWASLDILADGTLRPSSWGSGWVRGCEARVIRECLVAAGIVALVFYYDQEPFAKITRAGLGLEPV